MKRTPAICCAASRRWPCSRTSSIKGYRPQLTTAKPLYDEWPIGLTIDGNYHNFALFLDRVSKFPRIINIGNLAIDSIDKPTAAATMAITATATTFVLVDRPVEVPPPSKKKAPAKKDAGEEIMMTRTRCARHRHSARGVRDRGSPAEGCAEEGCGNRAGRAGCAGRPAAALAAAELSIRGPGAARSVPEPVQPRHRCEKHAGQPSEPRASPA